MIRLPQLAKGVLELVAGCILMLLMLVTVVDVVGRYFLSAPVHGGHVVVQILVSLLVFVGLPLLVADDAFIKVELLDGKLSDGAQRLRKTFFSLASAAILAGLAGQLAWQAWYFADNGEYYESIEIPVSWVAIFGGICCGIAAITAWSRFFRPRRDTESR